MTAVRGRYAPSPTGLVHVGSARTALAAWLSVRAQEGSFVWRLEDLDPPRIVPGTATAAMEDLAWLGLDWDEGPDVGGPFGPYVQSRRSTFYEEAIADLAAGDRLFPCRRSRKDLESLASAPHGAEASAPYPAAFRPVDLEPDWLEHGLYAYQLAVVVDDLLMEINEVVRGADLLGSTARQIQLLEALGGTPPAYAHVPLVVNAQGEKLSKRDAGLTLRSLRGAGVRPEALVGYLGWSLGLLDRPEPCPAAGLISRFGWERVGKEIWILPEDLAEEVSIPRPSRGL
jgi:glutamyl-tRNA synthetase